MEFELNFFYWFLSFIPIVAVLTLIMAFSWSGGKSGAFSWFIAAVIGYLFFGANLKLLAVASLKGLWTTIFILYIIWGAMALYNIVSKIDGFEVIARTFTGLTGNTKVLQLLVISWGFVSLLQGVAGFGTPVAVAAPLLVGLGFSPVIATSSALLGRAWAVTFGSLGSSYAALLKMTNLDPSGLAFWSSIFLTIVCIVTGLSISYLYNGKEGLKKGAPAALAIAISMGFTLIITANFVLPYIASLVAGLVGMGVGTLVLPKTKWYNNNPVKKSVNKNKMSFHSAFAPYYTLLILAFGIYLTPLKSMLSKLEIGLSFPRTETALGIVNEATASYSPISILTTPGTLVFLSVVISIIYFIKKGLWKKHYGKEVVGSLIKQAIPSTVTVMTMSMMAVVMMETGMTAFLAKGTAEIASSVFPGVSPFIGILGSFMTGSNTSSNIVFAAFQKDVAVFLGINSLIIASLQTTGGAIGTIISPMNVALGTGVTKIVGKEGEIIKKTIIYVIIMGLSVGIPALFLIYYLGF
ncbi:MAG TPA: L-lactate permease [Halanaerobiales bacterium]|nr:L-lactate permease [Halanaerobiales bacterium]